MLVKHSLFYYHQFRRSSKFWIKGDNMQLALWVFCFCLNKEVIINGTPFLFEFINACVIHEYHLLFFFFFFVLVEVLFVMCLLNLMGLSLDWFQIRELELTDINGLLNSTLWAYSPFKIVLCPTICPPTLKYYLRQLM